MPTSPPSEPNVLHVDVCAILMQRAQHLDDNVSHSPTAGVFMDCQECQAY